MHPLPEVFPQRRTTKLLDPLWSAASAKDVPADITFVRMQQSFKGSLEAPYQRSNVLLGWVKYAILCGLVVTAIFAVLVYSAGGLFAGANVIGRQCLDVRPHLNSSPSQHSFAMVTLSDNGAGIPGRSFQGLMELVAPNKISYAQRYGYNFIEASDTLDQSRPPSWSKILAVRKHLPNFDWVFWNDVDSLVTNFEISLQDIVDSVLASDGHSDVPDLIITEDVTGVNAGMFFFRNTEWSMRFLDTWWNQTSFVRPFGQKKSGDNDALKYLLHTMPEEELRKHVRVPKMQCAFNSYVWRPTFKSGVRFVTMPATVWKGAYSMGDFMVHLAGLNDKKAWVERFRQDIERKDTLLSQRLSRKEGQSWSSY